MILPHLVEHGVVFVAQRGNRHLDHRLDVDHLEQQQRVVCGERAARLTDHVRHGQLELAAVLGQRVDHVVRVLLERVVDARVRRGVRPVVVDTEAAAHVHVSDIDSQRAQLGIEPRDLLEARLDVADVGDL